MPYCPKCGKEVGGGASSCGACGYNLQDEDLDRPLLGAKGQLVKCTIHPARDSIGICAGCGNPVCELCRTFIENRVMCPSCVDKSIHKLILGEAGAKVKEDVQIQRFADVHWNRQSGFNSILLGVGLLFTPFLVWCCINVLTGDIYFNKYDKNGALKKWSRWNKLAAFALLVIVLCSYVGIILRMVNG